MKKFNNLNVITIIAMFMIFNIHFFNNFSTLITSDFLTLIENILRGGSLIAVLLFLVNTAYTSFYLEKPINYRTLFLYIIIPTLLFQQLNFLVFDQYPAEYNFSGGFVGSWFGEMYIYVILFIPLLLKVHKKNNYIAFVISIFFVLFGYRYSIVNNSATAQNLGMLMTIPYLGLVYILYNMTFKVPNKPSKNIYNLIFLMPFILLEILAYCGVFANKYIITSYFSIVSIAAAVFLSRFIFALDLPELNYRKISRTSYFFYFTHYIVINYYEMYIFKFVENNLILAYIFGIIAAYILAYIIYNLYDITVQRALSL